MKSRVLLVVMPFLPLERPALGVGLLKAGLARRNLPCDVKYFNHNFADEVGLFTYQRILQSTPTHDLAGEWVFTSALYGECALPDQSFADQVLSNGDTHFYDRDFVRQIEQCRSAAPDFIRKCAAKIDTSIYDIIGFSSTFQQNIPSLALAQELKRKAPEVVIVFGGANCEDEMGVELHRCFPFIDVVCSGEADAVFPDLVDRLRSGESLDDLGGVTYRKNGLTVTSPVPQKFIENLDELPHPDHDEFLSEYSASGAASVVNPQLTLETSRGCWWGQKHHCTFCGLNGLGMTYRSKSPARAFDEIFYLVETYGITSFFNTDNILDMRYFRELFPRLVKEGVKLQLYYEMKSNLKKEQLLSLRDLGTYWLQPGIESLNSHVLSLMDKGVKGIQNVQLMRWARESGMNMTWNIICGFPGEAPNDYEEIARTAQAIVHLQPPSSFSQFRLDRFSPMFVKSEKYGLKNVKPYRSYGLCYPFPTESLHRLAYFFEYDSPITPETAGAITNAWLDILEWKRNYRKGSLIGIVSPKFLLILDTRPNRPAAQYLYTGLEREIYLAADSARSVAHILTSLKTNRLDVELEELEVQVALDQFVEHDLMLREDDLYLRLALIPPEDDTAPEEVGVENDEYKLPFTQVEMALS